MCAYSVATRTKVLRHGDLNTGNIRYRPKKDEPGKFEFIFHDFQFVQLATIGMGTISSISFL
jgi:hypothetical protein